MPRLLLKTLIVTALLTLNAFLFFAFKNRKEDIALGYKELTESPVEGYEEIDRLNNGLRYVLSDDLYHPGDMTSQAAESLTKVVRAIRKRYVPDQSTLTPPDYFAKRTTLDDTLQSKLLKALEQYVTLVSMALENNLAGKIHYRDSICKIMKAEIERIEIQFNKGEVGKRQETKVLLVNPLDGSRAPLDFNFVAIRNNNGIQWIGSSYYRGADDYFNLLKILGQSTHSANVAQCRRSLGKINASFNVPGKLDVYGKLYQLSSMTPAEVDSICKYLLLLVWETNKSLIAGYRELTNLQP